MNRSLPLALGLAIAALASPLAAKDKDKDQVIGDTPSAAFSAVTDCRALADAAARLACYDRTVAAMEASRAAKDLVVTDRAALREARRGLFGISLPTIKIFGSGNDDDEVNEIEGKIARLSVANDLMPVFILEDGARWKMTDGRNPFAKPGQAIKIRRGLLGSFIATIDGGVGVRVIRQAN
jgi:hypothetical protein